MLLGYSSICFSQPQVILKLVFQFYHLLPFSQKPPIVIYLAPTIVIHSAQTLTLQPVIWLSHPVSPLASTRGGGSS